MRAPRTHTMTSLAAAVRRRFDLRRSARFAAAVTLLCALGLLDACFTLLIITRGAVEANPLMRSLLEMSEAHFLVGKMLITFIGAVMICACLRERAARNAYAGVAAAYTILIAWHLHLQVVL